MQKGRKTCLTNQACSISHHIMPLVINALGADTHTHARTHTHACKPTFVDETISRNQAHTSLTNL